MSDLFRFQHSIISHTYTHTHTYAQMNEAMLRAVLCCVVGVVVISVAIPVAVFHIIFIYILLSFFHLTLVKTFNKLKQHPYHVQSNCNSYIYVYVRMMEIKCGEKFTEMHRMPCKKCDMVFVPKKKDLLTIIESYPIVNYVMKGSVIVFMALTHAFLVAPHVFSAQLNVC